MTQAVAGNEIWLRPTHKPVQEYYAKRREHETQNVLHELAVKVAFQSLLDAAARKRGWSVIPEETVRRRGKTVRPDAVVKDAFGVPRGYWEAKDTADDLDAEIAKKLKKGYPAANLIFEDTRAAVLYQNDAEAMRVNLADPGALCDLVNAFLRHTEPDLERFDEAVDEFKDRVPELGKALATTLADAHKTNATFQSAFARLLALCRESLNPNLRREAVDEMLVQHLLTERLIRKIFDNPDFVRRNVIAAEIERVIDALTGRSFSRGQFMRQLDRFYVAIEEVADRLLVRYVTSNRCDAVSVPSAILLTQCPDEAVIVQWVARPGHRWSGCEADACGIHVVRTYNDCRFRFQAVT